MGSAPTNQMILLEAAHGLETENPISPLHLRAPRKKLLPEPAQGERNDPSFLHGNTESFRGRGDSVFSVLVVIPQRADATGWENFDAATSCGAIYQAIAKRDCNEEAAREDYFGCRRRHLAAKRRRPSGPRLGVGSQKNAGRLPHG